MRIDRVDMPEPELLAVTLRAPGHKETLLARLSGAARGLSLVAVRPTGAPADASVSKLRHHVTGRRLERISGRLGHNLDLALAASPGRRASLLRLSFAAKLGNALVADDAGRVLCALRRPPATVDRNSETEQAGMPWSLSLQTLRAQSTEPSAAPIEDPDAVRLRDLVSRRLRQLRRRLNAIQGDLERGERAQELRRHANLLLSALHRLGGGERLVEVVDYGQTPPEQLTLLIADGLDAKQQADRWFKQARRFERGVDIARTRLRETQALIERGEALLSDQQVAEMQQPQVLAALGIDMTAAGGERGRERPGRGAVARGGARRKAYRTFLGHGGKRILVGRGAADNDELTLHKAAPHDLWLHAHGAAGAHVVVPLDKGKPCTRELLIDAALLAAHFSKFKADAQVEVDYAPKRYVRKPKGSRPGLVRVERAQTVLVKLDPARVRILIAAEVT